MSFQNQLLALLLFQFSYFMLSFSWVAALRLFNDFVKIRIYLNKFHYAITGQTAAEIIDTHADNKSPNMGLQTWKNAPKGRILKSNTKIAKNYLSENEIKDLERAISAYSYYFSFHILCCHFLGLLPCVCLMTLSKSEFIFCVLFILIIW
jgi:hypothetical protein